MRRLVVLLSSIVALDITFFAALAPLLPHFVVVLRPVEGRGRRALGRYAAGVLAASLPSGLAAARYGPRVAALGGVSLTAVASVAFALRRRASGCSARPGSCRAIGSALSWAGALAWLVAAAPRERRGALIGTTMGAAVFGALLGPVIGAIATVAGVTATFVGVGVLGIVLAAWVAADAGRARAAAGRCSELFRRADRRLLGGMWLLVLPALLFGVAGRARAADAARRRLGRRRDRRRLPRDRRARDRC